MNERIPLLLIPGLAANGHLWRRQIEDLSDIADCWTAPLPAWNNLGAIAETILASAPSRFAVAGWSMGGYLGFEILRRAPERVLRLALFSTTADPERPEVTRRRRMMLHSIKKFGFTSAMRNLAPRFLHPMHHNSDIVEFMVKQAFEVGADAFRQHQLAMMDRSDYRDLLPGIQTPTLVLVGKQDIVTEPEGHSRLAQSINNAELVVVDGAAHMVTLEKPNAVTLAMRRWLTQDTRALAA